MIAAEGPKMSRAGDRRVLTWGSASTQARHRKGSSSSSPDGWNALSKRPRRSAARGGTRTPHLSTADRAVLSARDGRPADPAPLTTAAGDGNAVRVDRTVNRDVLVGLTGRFRTRPRAPGRLPGREPHRGNTPAFFDGGLLSHRGDKPDAPPHREASPHHLPSPVIRRSFRHGPWPCLHAGRRSGERCGVVARGGEDSCFNRRGGHDGSPDDAPVPRANRLTSPSRRSQPRDF